MDTIVDKQLNGTWQSAYALTALAAGTPLLIQNKSSNAMRLFISAAAPAAGTTDGWVVVPGDAVEVTSGQTGCWLSGSGPVSIQSGV